MATIPDLLAAFEVWQNMFADYPNVVSQKIFVTALAWLEDIEARQHSEEFSYNPGPWRELERGGIEELEQRLRALYYALHGLSPRTSVITSCGFATWTACAGTPSVKLSTMLRRWWTTIHLSWSRLQNLRSSDDLPADEQVRDSRRRTFARGISYHDWHRLSIREDHGIFYPPSPLREPFASLFRFKPDEARGLVRDITNHAITAWRQLSSSIAKIAPHPFL